MHLLAWSCCWDEAFRALEDDIVKGATQACSRPSPARRPRGPRHVVALQLRPTRHHHRQHLTEVSIKPRRPMPEASRHPPAAMVRSEVMIGPPANIVKASDALDIFPARGTSRRTPEQCVEVGPQVVVASCSSSMRRMMPRCSRWA